MENRAPTLTAGIKSHVAVVGGGDSAVEEGTFLTRYGKKIHLIHRRDDYRAQPILVEQMRASGKVDEVPNTVVDEIHGRDGRIRDSDTVPATQTEERLRPKVDLLGTSKPPLCEKSDSSPLLAEAPMKFLAVSSRRKEGS